jgi:hypothetical protein
MIYVSGSQISQQCTSQQLILNICFVCFDGINSELTSNPMQECHCAARIMISATELIMIIASKLTYFTVNISLFVDYPCTMCRNMCMVLACCLIPKLLETAKAAKTGV